MILNVWPLKSIQILFNLFKNTKRNDEMVENNFEQYGFNETTMSVIKKLNFKKPTTIQQKVIPKVMAGESVVGQSQTGSGKTHAFLLPLFNQIQVEKREIQFVITAPTRELATQLYEEVKKVITLDRKSVV